MIVGDRGTQLPVNNLIGGDSPTQPGDSLEILARGRPRRLLGIHGQGNSLGIKSKEERERQAIGRDAHEQQQAQGNAQQGWSKSEDPRTVALVAIDRARAATVPNLTRSQEWA